MFGWLEDLLRPAAAKIAAPASDWNTAPISRHPNTAPGSKASGKTTGGTLGWFDPGNGKSGSVLSNGTPLGGGGGGWDATLAAANAAGRAASQRQNDNTRALADAQFKLLSSFASQRDSKLGNIQRALDTSDAVLLGNYGTALGNLRGSLSDNDKAESDESFSNIANAVRERSDLLSQVSSQGAGETDVLRAQLQSLRNYNANQSEINRAFFDTLRSVNTSIDSLNRDTGTSRANLWQQAEADREQAMANYNNQIADTWTQILNIENANTNVNSDSSVAYKKKYGSAADEAAKAAAQSYERQGLPSNWLNWAGRGSAEERALASSNRAATVNLGVPLKAPEGATLRNW